MRKIAITGPESTGKSALCEALAKHYRAPWVPEFARTYLEGRQPPYTPADLDAIAKGQIQAGQEIEASHPSLIFYDTEMTVMKIWSEHAFDTCSPFILDAYANQQFDLYLLTDIDLPWEPDPLREHPQLRSYFFERYKDELFRANRNFHIISGTGNNRTYQAIREIDRWMNAR